MRVRLISLGFLLLFLLSFQVNAQQRVGLVLSGGGAKGVAHIGVIRALEANGIPIDYIAGTSMGAIIGGLYASGYTTDEMEAILKSKDFSYWVSGEFGEENTYYFKKQDPNASWINLRFNYDSVFTSNIIPTNLISPNQMDFAFLKLFAGATAASRGSFDKLMIPFRCVASDIANKQQAVLRTGDLGKAIRASMTFPFYFKPITIEGKLMFDGGMLNNFPTDVMLNDFYPDIIIGSKVASNYDPPKINDLVSQLQSMLTVESKYDVPCDNGVLIEPKLRSVNVIDFSHTQEFIDSGYVAAQRMIPQIRKFVTTRFSLAELAAKRKEFKDRVPELQIGSIYVNGLNNNQAEYVRWHLFHTGTSAPLNVVKSNYFKLLGDSQIASIFPTLKYNPERSWYDLYLNVEKENNINVQFGGTISSSPINEAFLGLRYNRLGKSALVYRANIYIGKFYSSAEIGARWDFPSTHPYYIDASLCFNQWDFFKTSTYFFEDKTPSYLIQNENHSEVNFGWPAGRKAKFEFGLATAKSRDDYYQTNEFNRNDVADKTYFNFFTPNISYEANTLNDKQFANQGARFFTDIRYVTGKETNEPGTTSLQDVKTSENHDWFQFRLEWDNYFKVLGKLRLGSYVETFLSTKRLFSNYTSSMLSARAFAPFPYAQTVFMPEFRANNFVAVGLKNVYVISKSFDYRVEGYAFQPLQEIVKQTDFKAVYDSKIKKPNFMATTAIVFHGPIGPATLSLNWFDRNQDRFSFVFTIGYVIFNRRALD
ncbi:MAG: patatin-like phospholipase family protein [Bacteroidetes bacterium]|nr:patatin-like phospholipase family protein [Bacteroidota bacterium]